MTIDVQLVIVTGTNHKVYKWLKRIEKRTNKKIIAYSFVDHIDELMELATVVVSKPGGLTTSEVLAKGVPMVIVQPIPGQETYNTNFLLKKGIAVKVDEIQEVGRAIESLLGDPQKLLSMSQAALAHSHPHAAREIAKLVLEND